MKKLLLVGVVVLGLAAVSGALVWKFVLSPSGLSGDDVKYLPNDCQLIASFKAEEALASDAYRQLKRDVKDVEKNFEESFEKENGIAVNKLVRATVGVRFGGKEEPEIVGVFRTSKAITAAEIQAAKKIPDYKKNFKYNEVTVGRYTIYEETHDDIFSFVAVKIDPNAGKIDPKSGPPARRTTGSAFCVPDSKIVLIGKTDVLRKVLERGKPPELSEAMKLLIKQADFAKSAALAFDLKAALATPETEKELKRGFQFLPGIDDLLGKVHGLALDANVAGSQLTANATLVCKDDKSAEDIKKIVDGALVMAKNALKDQKEVPREVAELLEAIKLSASGAKVTATVKGTSDPLIKWVKMAEESRPQPSFRKVGPPVKAKDVFNKEGYSKDFDKDDKNKDIDKKDDGK